MDFKELTELQKPLRIRFTFWPASTKWAAQVLSHKDEWLYLRQGGANSSLYFWANLEEAFKFVKSTGALPATIEFDYNKLEKVAVWTCTK